MERRRFRTLSIAIALVVGTATVAASILVPAVYLWRADDETLDRWSRIGEALSVVGVFFSGIAFLAIAGALLLQQRELTNQREELALVREEQQRNSEVSLRQLHMDIVKMALDDRDLLSVWPQPGRSIRQRKKDHYCNLYLNLQKVAHETGTIDIDELRGALRRLMGSRDMYSFWQRSRSARVSVTQGDEAEDFFTAEVDHAFSGTDTPAVTGFQSVIERGLAVFSRPHR